MSDETTFPSITFPATFEGTAAIGSDFSATLKLKTGDGPAVLRDLKGLPRGTYDVTIVSRQGALAGDSLDREWASTALQEDMQDAGDLEFAEHCIGGQCPHFAVATSGELEGAYVCQLDPEAPVRVVHDETACPLYPQAEPEGNSGDDGVEHLDFEPEADGEQPADATGELSTPCVVAVFPAPDEPDGEYPVATDVGEHTTYAELAADFTTWSGRDIELRDLAVVDESSEPRKLREVIHSGDYGKRLHVVVLAESPDLARCPVCTGDGRQPDKSGGGHHGTCENCGGFGCVDRGTVSEGDAA